MPTIHLTTFIAAPTARVFDLARSVNLQKRILMDLGAEFLSSTRFGLQEKGDMVTWQVKYLFKKRTTRLKITEMSLHESFIEEQSEGSFKSLKHEHFFKPCENGTIMIDLFHYEIAWGLIGQWINNTILYKYLKRMLEQKNKGIQHYAETDNWKKLLEK